MNCQQCGLPLDPQQIAQTGQCPRCGAAVAVQQPIAVNVYTAPPGAYPPVSAQPGYGAPPVSGMPPQGYPGGMMPPPPQKKKTGLIAVISAVVVVVVVMGSLLALGLGGKGPLSSLGHSSSPTTNSSTPAATATSTIPAGFKVYTSQGHLYNVAVPSDWTQSVDDSDPEEVEFTGPANQEAITDDFTPESGVTPESYTTTICGVVTGFSSDTPQPTQVTIAGQSWTRVECDSSDGATHVVVEAVSYKGNIASFLFSSDASSFAQNQTQFFSVMERTFAFLN